MTQTCPSCAQPASGRFCSNCGSSLEAPRNCRDCSAELLPGAHFCNMCGAEVSPAAARPADAARRPTISEQPVAAGRETSRLPWYIAGVALVALAAIVLFPRFGSERSATAAPPFAAPGAPAGDPGAVDLSSMTPEEAADRLFDRVMRLASAGDSAQARTFVPMALGAYERVGELNDDARYHVGVLHLLGGDAAAARAQADTILASEPNHLLALFTAAQAEQARGNGAAARELFQRFLDAYPREIARDLPEYQAHAAALPEMRAQAQAGVGA
jgi:hypothetical protein